MTKIEELLKVPKNLFDIEARLICRKDGPETSLRAAEKMVGSGRLSQQENQVLHEIEWQLAIYKKTDFTPKELADKWSLIVGDKSKIYHKVERRLSGLHRKGKIERTGGKREGCCVWKLVK